jgi:hypothetical protein
MPAPRTARSFAQRQAPLIASIVAAALIFLAGPAKPAAAQRAPASFVDIHVDADALEVTLVAHVIDVAHDLQIAPPDSLLKASVLDFRGDGIIWLLRGRIRMAAGDHFLGDGTWSKIEALPDQQSLRLHGHYGLGGQTGTVSVKATLFPYDPMHQTFVKFYENNKVTAEAILDRTHTQFEYVAGARQ